MEDSLLTLVKSYIASEERLRNAQTRILKKKIQALGEELFSLETEFVSRESSLISENVRLTEKLDRLKKVAYTLGVMVVTLVGIICFKF